MDKVICFGEMLLRFSPTPDGSWLNDNVMPVFVGGAELNVATALSLWKIPVGYVSALPDNYLTQQLLNYIREKDINISSLLITGDRIGTYYLPRGEELKHADVIYDRKESSFSNLQPGKIDCDMALSQCEWLHMSAISPSLNTNVAAVCMEAVQAASRKDIKISFDLNYRQKLWESNKDAANSIHEILQYCNVIMGNIWSEEKMLGIGIDDDLQENKERQLEQSQRSSERIMNLYPSCKMVANTFRLSRKDGIRYYATLFTDNVLYTSSEYSTEHAL